MLALWFRKVIEMCVLFMLCTAISVLCLSMLPTAVSEDGGENLFCSYSSVGTSYLIYLIFKLLLLILLFLFSLECSVTGEDRGKDARNMFSCSHIDELDARNMFLCSHINALFSSALYSGKRGQRTEFVLFI